MKRTRVRLYVDHPLGQGQSVPVDRAQAHYLFGVMRLATGDRVMLFNGRDGEFPAEVQEAGKSRGEARCLEQARTLMLPPDLGVGFAPIE